MSKITFGGDGRDLSEVYSHLGAYQLNSQAPMEHRNQFSGIGSENHHTSNVGGFFGGEITRENIGMPQGIGIGASKELDRVRLGSSLSGELGPSPTLEGGAFGKAMFENISKGMSDFGAQRSRNREFDTQEQGASLRMRPLTPLGGGMRPIDGGMRYGLDDRESERISHLGLAQQIQRPVSRQSSIPRESIGRLMFTSIEEFLNDSSELKMAENNPVTLGPKLLPPDIMNIYSMEQKNLEDFARFLAKEKEQIERDSDEALRAIISLFDQFKLQLFHQIDEVFQRGISLYAEYKERIESFLGDSVDLMLKSENIMRTMREEVSSVDDPLASEIAIFKIKKKQANLIEQLFTKMRNFYQNSFIKETSENIMGFVLSRNPNYDSRAYLGYLGSLKDQIQERLVNSEQLANWEFIAHPQLIHTTHENHQKFPEPKDLQQSMYASHEPEAPLSGNLRFQGHHHHHFSPNERNAAPARTTQSREEQTLVPQSNIGFKKGIGASLANLNVKGFSKFAHVRCLSKINKICRVSDFECALLGENNQIAIVNMEKEETLMILEAQIRNVTCMACKQLSSGPFGFGAKSLVYGGDNNEPFLVVHSLKQDKKGPECTRLTGSEVGFTCITSLSDSRCVITGTFDGHAILWDLISGVLLARIKAHRSQVLVQDAQMDGNIFVSGGSDKRIALFQMEKAGKDFKNLQYNNEIYEQVDITAIKLGKIKGSLVLLTGDVKGNIKFWDVVSGTCTNIIYAHDTPVVGLGVADLRSGGVSVIVSFGLSEHVVKLWPAGQKEALLVNLSKLKDEWRIPEWDSNIFEIVQQSHDQIKIVMANQQTNLLPILDLVF